MGNLDLIHQPLETVKNYLIYSNFEAQTSFKL